MYRNSGTEASFTILVGGGERYQRSMSPIEYRTVPFDLPAPIAASISDPVDAYLDFSRSANHIISFKTA